MSKYIRITSDHVFTLPDDCPIDTLGAAITQAIGLIVAVHVRGGVNVDGMVKVLPLPPPTVTPTVTP